MLCYRFSRKVAFIYISKTYMGTFLNIWRMFLILSLTWKNDLDHILHKSVNILNTHWYIWWLFRMMLIYKREGFISCFIFFLNTSKLLVLFWFRFHGWDGGRFCVYSNSWRTRFLLPPSQEVFQLKTSNWRSRKEGQGRWWHFKEKNINTMHKVH